MRRSCRLNEKKRKEGSMMLSLSVLDDGGGCEPTMRSGSGYGLRCLFCFYFCEMVSGTIMTWEVKKMRGRKNGVFG